MEGKEWIYTLPAGADRVHERVGGVKVESGKVKVEVGDKGREGIKEDAADKVDKGKRVASGFMASKYLAKDVLAVSDLVQTPSRLLLIRQDLG